MPVVFAQPSPMAPDIAAGGGRAEVATKDFGALAGLYESQMRNQLAASQSAAQLGLHASAQTAALGERQAEMNMRQQEMAAQRQAQQEGIAAQVQAQQEGRVQQAQLAQWLQSQELSQAETMRLERMQSAIGAVQADPNLTPDQKTDLMLQLKTGIDPLRQRQEAAKTQMIQQQAEMAKNTGLIQAAHDQVTRQGLANNWDANSKELDDGTIVTWDAKGTPHFHKGESIDFGKMYMDAEKHVAEEEKAAAAANKDNASYKPMTPEERVARVRQIAEDAHQFVLSKREAEKLDRKGLEKRFDPTTGQSYFVPKNLPQGQKPGVPEAQRPPERQSATPSGLSIKANRELLADVDKRIAAEEEKIRQQRAAETLPPTDIAQGFSY